MEIYHGDQLIVKDNVLIQPEVIPISSIGNLEEYTHQGTLIFYSTKDNVDKTNLVEMIYNAAETYHEEMEIGVSAMENNGFVIRALGHGGEIMYNFFLYVQEILWALE